MIWVTEYRRCEQACRDLANILTKPDDKRALELMATGYAARASELKRILNLQNGEAQPAERALGARIATSVADELHEGRNWA